MILLLHLLTILQHKVQNKQKYNSISEKDAFSTTNFYNITNIWKYELNSLQSGDTINIFINNRNLRLFIYIDNNEEAISYYINGQIKEYPSPYAASIDSNDNITLNFPTSTQQKHKFRAVLWLIPTNLCPSNSLYTYGNDRIMISAKKLMKNTEYTTCIFSFALDSLDDRYNISFGTEIKRTDLWGISSLYSNNFENPDKTVSKYASDEFYNIEKSFLIQYKITSEIQIKSTKSNKNEQSIVFYRQIKSPSPNKNSKCSVTVFRSCNLSSSVCNSSSDFESIETNCFPSQEKRRTVLISIVTIVPVVILIIIVIVVIVCTKKLKKKKNEQIDDTLNKPLTGKSSYNNL